MSSDTMQDQAGDGVQLLPPTDSPFISLVSSCLLGYTKNSQRGTDDQQIEWVW